MSIVFSWIILSFIILILVTTIFKSRPGTNLRRLFCFIEIVEISHFIANNVSVKTNVLREVGTLLYPQIYPEPTAMSLGNEH